MINKSNVVLSEIKWWERRTPEHLSLHRRSGVAYCIHEFNFPIKLEGRESCLFGVMLWISRSVIYSLCAISSVYLKHLHELKDKNSLGYRYLIILLIQLNTVRITFTKRRIFVSYDKIVFEYFLLLLLLFVYLFIITILR